MRDRRKNAKFVALKRMAMKRLIATACGAAIALLPLFGDTIVKKDGSTVTAYNVEEAGKWLLYTLSDEPAAALQRVLIVDVAEVRRDTLKASEVVAPEPNISLTVPDFFGEAPVPGRVGATPAADNAALIERYNSQTIAPKKAPKPGGKAAEVFVAVWGFIPGSVLSDDKITVSFTRQKFSKEPSAYFVKIKLTNKTDSTLYVDPGASYTLYKGGDKVPMNKDGEVFAIEPHSARYLPGHLVKDGDRSLAYYEPLYFRSKIFNPWFEEYKNDQAKCYRAALAAPHGLDKGTHTRADIAAMPGEYTVKTPENTPKRIKKVIVYSTSPQFETSTELPLDMYIRGVMGDVTQPYKWAPVGDPEGLLWGVSVVE